MAGGAPRRSLARHLSEVQLLLDQTPSFLALTQGPDHVVAITNDACLVLTGRRREELVGLPILQVLPELQAQALGPLFEVVLKTGNSSTGHAVKLDLTDQTSGVVTHRRIDFTLQPIFDATNQTTGILIQGLDVTERELAIEALRAADRNKDNFLATLAHEMLNPLSASQLGVEILGVKLATAEPEITRAVAVLRRQYTLLASLVGDLLDISRIRLGKVTLRSENVDLGGAVAAAIETCEHHLKASSHTLRVVMTQPAMTITADRRHIVQVLTNLLINASKFTPPGGAIAVDVHYTSEVAEITVTDNGKGMTAEEARTAFDLYQQHDSPNRTTRGLGIGLALVRQLVELQGGSVRASSPGPSLGTSISVIFPIGADPSQAC